MKLRLQVDIGDGPFEVKTNLFSVVEWERKYRRRASQIATEGIGIEDLAFLAYVSIKAGAVDVTVPVVFDDFLKKLVDIDVLEEEPPNPTKAVID